MSQNNCLKCSHAPCLCGHAYRDWIKNKRIEYAASILGVSVSYIEDTIYALIPEEHPMKVSGPGMNPMPEITIVGSD